MGGAEPQQLGAGEPGRPDDAHLDHRRMMHHPACSCKLGRMGSVSGAWCMPAHPSVTTVDPDLDERTDERTETGPPKAAHIVKTEPGESAVAKVTEARIYGYPVEALCGERFVPQQDPKKLPLCGVCKEIYDLYRQLGDGGLNETPGT